MQIWYEDQIIIFVHVSLAFQEVMELPGLTLFEDNQIKQKK